jgi:hypothetical protein
MDAGVAEEQLLRSVKIVSYHGHLNGRASLSPGGADDKEARLRQARAERLLRSGARSEPGSEDTGEERSDGATATGTVQQVHDGILETAAR